MQLCYGRQLTALFFFFNDTATTEIYTLSLHDALPIWAHQSPSAAPGAAHAAHRRGRSAAALRDRKSTRLNSSHGYISYAVFCLKKKNTVPPHYVAHSLPVPSSGLAVPHLGTRHRALAR